MSVAVFLVLVLADAVTQEATNASDVDGKMVFSCDAVRRNQELSDTGVARRLDHGLLRHG